MIEWNIVWSFLMGLGITCGIIFVIWLIFQLICLMVLAKGITGSFFGFFRK